MNWQDIKDSLPPKGKQVLVLIDKTIVHAFWDDMLSNFDWFDVRDAKIINGITHWKLLPPIPTVDRKYTQRTTYRRIMGKNK